VELERLKIKIQEEVEAHRREIIDLSMKIHRNPEVGWEEVQASGWLASYLEKHGFKVERGICSLPTAFRASYGQGKPVIAFVAEYDALPNGHACGHNLIGSASARAGVAARLAADEFGGTILVMGSPAEELLGGKVIQVNEGAFDGADVAMMVHPAAPINWSGFKSMACTTLDVEFFGKAAHGSRSWEGINALEALLLAFNSINSLRPYAKDKSRIFGIITDGGKAANVVPEHSAGKFMLRTPEDTQLDELCEKALDCFKGAALVTGARLEYKWGLRANAMRSNSALVRVWSKNMEAVGRKVEEKDEIKYPSGSTDMGNVSLVVPSIHPFIAIASEPMSSHSTEFAVAAASDGAKQALIDGAKALAMTAVDVMAQPETLSEIKEEFLQAVTPH